MDPNLTFVSGFVYRRDAFYIRAVVRQLDQRGVQHAVMLRMLDGAWGRWLIDRRIVGHGVYDTGRGRTVVAAAADGHVQIGSPAGFEWEQIDSSNDGPNDLRSLRSMRRIGDWLYVTGMQRMTYRRLVEGGSWQRIDASLRVPAESTDIAGFSAIDGSSETDIYAGGLHGEFWDFSNGVWRRIPLPTNVAINDILVVAADQAYACGLAGILLTGNGDHWRIVENDATEDGFWSLAWLNGRLYIASDQGAIYTINNDVVETVDLGLDRTVSTFSLHADDGVLLSVGTEDILLFDGGDWRDLGHPPLDPPAT